MSNLRGSSFDKNLMRTETSSPAPCYLNPALHFASQRPGPSRDPMASTGVALPTLLSPVAAWTFS